MRVWSNALAIYKNCNRVYSTSSIINTTTNISKKDIKETLEISS